jgi:hypothetical protein
MSVDTVDTRTVADVKCYHCGHISGQVFGRRHQPLRVTDFVPRRGYTGPEVRPGTKLRCERCQGPVFLEDITNTQSLSRRMPRRSTEQGARRVA